MSGQVENPFSLSNKSKGGLRGVDYLLVERWIIDVVRFFRVRLDLFKQNKVKVTGTRPTCGFALWTFQFLSSSSSFASPPLFLSSFFVGGVSFNLIFMIGVQITSQYLSLCTRVLWLNKWGHDLISGRRLRGFNFCPTFLRRCRVSFIDFFWLKRKHFFPFSVSRPSNHFLFINVLFRFSFDAFAVWWTTSPRLNTRNTWTRWRAPPTPVTPANADWSSANPSACKGTEQPDCTPHLIRFLLPLHQWRRPLHLWRRDVD